METNDQLKGYIQNLRNDITDLKNTLKSHGPLERLYNTRETAKILGVKTTSAVTKMISSLKLESYQPNKGKRHWIPQSSIDAYLKRYKK